MVKKSQNQNYVAERKNNIVVYPQKTGRNTSIVACEVHALPVTTTTKTNEKNTSTTTKHKELDDIEKVKDTKTTEIVTTKTGGSTMTTIKTNLIASAESVNSKPSHWVAQETATKANLS